jgi:hypothetical protein
MRKRLPWLIAALIVLWIATDPHGAAAFARNAATFLKHAAVSFSTFGTSL